MTGTAPRTDGTVTIPRKLAEFLLQQADARLSDLGYPEPHTTDLDLARQAIRKASSMPTLTLRHPVRITHRGDGSILLHAEDIDGRQVEVIVTEEERATLYRLMPLGERFTNTDSRLDVTSSVGIAVSGLIRDVLRDGIERTVREIARTISHPVATVQAWLPEMSDVEPSSGYISGGGQFWRLKVSLTEQLVAGLEASMAANPPLQ